MSGFEFRYRRVLRMGACLVFMCVSSALLAQNYDNPSLGRQPVVEHPQDFKPLGIRAGGFMLRPGIELAGEWTDNVFYSNADEQSDFVYHVRPFIAAHSNWSRHALNVRLAADIGRYADFGIRDFEDYFLNVDGRFDIKTQSALSYNADWMDLHEDLNDRTAEQGIEPTEYTLTGYGVAYDHTFNRLSVKLDYDHRDLDFDNSIRADGSVIDNQDRDRSEDALGIRLSYVFRTDMQVFLGASWRDVDFDQEVDRNGYRRSGDGFTLESGVSMSITGMLNGDLFVSYHDRDYDDPALESVDGWAAGAGLTWYPTRLTTVRGSIASGIEETTSEYSSGYLGTIYQLRVDHELRHNWQINARLSYRDNDYEVLPWAPMDARRSDEEYGAGFGATWFLNRHMRLSASYDILDLSSNVPNDDYKVNRFWLVFGLEK